MQPALLEVPEALPLDDESFPSRVTLRTLNTLDEAPLIGVRVRGVDGSHWGCVMRFLEDFAIGIKLRFWVERALRRTVRRPEIKIFGPAEGATEGHVSRVYVINLDRQKRRWKHFTREAQFQKLPGKRNLFDLCQRVSAVDGRDIDSGDFLSTEIERAVQLGRSLLRRSTPRTWHREQKTCSDQKDAGRNRRLAVSLKSLAANR